MSLVLGGILSLQSAMWEHDSSQAGVTTFFEFVYSNIDTLVI